MTVTYFNLAEPGHATARIARFTTNSQATTETHICIEAPRTGSFEEQLAQVSECYASALKEQGLDESHTMVRRVFLSDIANQLAAVQSSAIGTSNAEHPTAVSVIEQPPLNGQRLAVWSYHISGVAPLIKQRFGPTLAFKRGPVTHLYTTGIGHVEPSGAFAQTHQVFESYESELAAFGANLKDHAIRTWLYVSDIDTEYAPLVVARRQRFLERGMNESTHYIASTGIAGRVANAQSRVVLDAYAIASVQPAQIAYLQANDHLGPTHLYGVTFERGTSVSFRDRKHVYISGTASIDPAGNTVHVGNVAKQCERAFANIEALLASASSTVHSLMQLTVYIRDAADADIVRSFIQTRAPQVPYVLVRAPVCRPNWLVEMECIGIVSVDAPSLPEF